MTRRDPVTHEVAVAVFQRDQGCVAPKLKARSLDCRGRLTIDHVQDEAGIGKRRAPSDPAHLVSLCQFHHTGSAAGSNWATSHRPELRAYLREVNG